MSDGHAEEPDLDDRPWYSIARGVPEDHSGDQGVVLCICVRVHAGGAGLRDYDLPHLHIAVVQ